MDDQLIIGWNGAKQTDFGVVPLQFDHNLHQHALFSEQSLARIFERLDRKD